MAPLSLQSMTQISAFAQIANGKKRLVTRHLQRMKRFLTLLQRLEAKLLPRTTNSRLTEAICNSSSFP
jgi:hypothetical protein